MTYRLPPAEDLTPLQLDGWGCIYCDYTYEDPSRPVGHVGGSLVFAHRDCAADNCTEGS